MYVCMYVCMYGWMDGWMTGIPAPPPLPRIRHCSGLVKYSVGQRAAKWLSVITAVTIIALYLKAFAGCNGLDGLDGEASPEKGTFLKLQAYERLEISLVEKYERVGKSVTSVGK